MAKYNIKMVQNDTAPALIFDVENADGTPYNLAGCTVRLKLLNNQTGALSNSGNMECVNLGTPVNRAQYDFMPGDIPDAGTYVGDLEITTATGKVQTEYEYVRINARPEVG